MDALVRLAVNLIISLVLAIRRAIKTPGWKRAWAAAAKELGYEADGLSLTGVHEDVLDVVVDTVSKGGSVNYMYTRARVSGPVIPATLSIAAEGFFTRTFKSPDIQIGHKPTDDALRIQGDDASALAVLGAETRDAIVSGVKKAAWVIDEGVVVHEIRGVLSKDKVIAFVREVFDFVEHFRMDRHTIDERLRDNGISDPVPDVRLRNLRELASRIDRSAAVRGLAEEAGRAACTSDDPRIRLEGVAMVGDEATLAAVAAGASDLGAEAGSRLAQLLAWRPIPTGEAALVGLLDHGSDGVKGAAADALGAIGSLSAVETLYDHANKRFGGDLKRRASTAIAAIQAREGAGARGGLSLAAPSGAEGGLSLPEALEGGLSMREDS